MGGTIFISYRRGADSGFAGRLYDRLENAFGRDQVFIDVDSIAPGEDFVAILEEKVGQCDVLLALIGRGWLAATDEAGQRRLDNPDDFVRIEIAAALEKAPLSRPRLSIGRGGCYCRNRPVRSPEPRERYEKYDYLSPNQHPDLSSSNGGEYSEHRGYYGKRPRI